MCTTATVCELQCPVGRPKHQVLPSANDGRVEFTFCLKGKGIFWYHGERSFDILIHVDIPFCPSTGHTWHLYLFTYNAWLVTDELQLHIGFLFWSQSLVLVPRPFGSVLIDEHILEYYQNNYINIRTTNYYPLKLFFVLGNGSHMGSHIHT